ncbi:MAG: hypothetical protein GY822_20900 [Deltaproteobacteria bacterium]|nr:hypothetical protein [Deltaproteobacteria bacterium]
MTQSFWDQAARIADLLDEHSLSSEELRNATGANQKAMQGRRVSVGEGNQYGDGLTSVSFDGSAALRAEKALSKTFKIADVALNIRDYPAEIAARASARSTGRVLLGLAGIVFLPRVIFVGFFLRELGVDNLIFCWVLGVAR